MLCAGGLSLLGLGLGDFLRLEASQPNAPKAKSFGKAKSCILLFLYGSPSQLETVDTKPDAPEGIRGELKAIRSSLPGCDVCELLPNMAKVMDRVTVVRSLTHPYPIHGVAYATTGVPTIDVPMELNPHDSRHWPFIGSVVGYLTQNAKRQGGAVPNNIALPWPFSTRRIGEVPRAGPYAAFLGGAHNPIWTEFEGEATGRVVKTLQDKTEEFKEPYIGIAPDCRFDLATSTALPNDITIDRLNQRRSLVEQFDTARTRVDPNVERGFDRYRQMAFGMIGSDKIRRGSATRMG
jgi:hypothetical protein